MASIKAAVLYIQSYFIGRFALFTCIIIGLIIFEITFFYHNNSKLGISAFVRHFVTKDKDTDVVVDRKIADFYITRPNQIDDDWNESDSLLPKCAIVPPWLEGPMKVDKSLYSNRQIESMYPNLDLGGRSWPRNCSSRHHVAIIVPFRDRPSHLKIFLLNIHHFLQQQELDYGLFIVELVQDVTFNRAMLFNIGYAEAIKLHKYSCFIFHDVDLIPEDDRNLYTCPEMPRHMSVAIDKHKYRLPYTQIFGGVSALTKEQFIQVNGFSNKYFGWGGEDDDMFKRIHSENFNIMRYSSEVARYQMLSHTKDVPNPGRIKLLKNSGKRYKSEGLNTLEYTVVKLELRKLYTWILVDINEKKIMEESPVTEEVHR